MTRVITPKNAELFNLAEDGSQGLPPGDFTQFGEWLLLWGGLANVSLETRKQLLPKLRGRTLKICVANSHYSVARQETGWGHAAIEYRQTKPLLSCTLNAIQELHEVVAIQRTGDNPKLLCERTSFACTTTGTFPIWDDKHVYYMFNKILAGGSAPVWESELATLVDIIELLQCPDWMQFALSETQRKLQATLDEDR